MHTHHTLSAIVKTSQPLVVSPVILVFIINSLLGPQQDGARLFATVMHLLNTKQYSHQQSDHLHISILGDNAQFFTHLEGQFFLSKIVRTSTDSEAFGSFQLIC